MYDSSLIVILRRLTLRSVFLRVRIVSLRAVDIVHGESGFIGFLQESAVRVDVHSTLRSTHVLVADSVYFNILMSMSDKY